MNNYNEALGHFILNKLNVVVKNGQSRHTGNIGTQDTGRRQTNMRHNAES